MLVEGGVVTGKAQENGRRQPGLRVNIQQKGFPSAFLKKSISWEANVKTTNGNIFDFNIDSILFNKGGSWGILSEEWQKYNLAKTPLSLVCRGVRWRFHRNQGGDPCYIFGFRLFHPPLMYSLPRMDIMIWAAITANTGMGNWGDCGKQGNHELVVKTTILTQ